MSPAPRAVSVSLVTVAPGLVSARVETTSAKSTPNIVNETGKQSHRIVKGKHDIEAGGGGKVRTTMWLGMASAMIGATIPATIGTGRVPRMLNAAMWGMSPHHLPLVAAFSAVLLALRVRTPGPPVLFSVAAFGGREGEKAGGGGMAAVTASATAVITATDVIPPAPDIIMTTPIIKNMIMTSVGGGDVAMMVDAVG